MVFPSLEGALCYFDEYMQIDQDDVTTGNFLICSSSNSVDVTATKTPRVEISNKNMMDSIQNNVSLRCNSSMSKSNDILKEEQQHFNTACQATSPSRGGRRNAASVAIIASSPSKSSTATMSCLLDDDDEDENIITGEDNTKPKTTKDGFQILSSYHNKRKRTTDKTQSIQSTNSTSIHSMSTNTPANRCCGTTPRDNYKLDSLKNGDDNGDNDNTNHNNKYNNANVDVLTRNIMIQFQDHLPMSKRDESFWLKYSLVHDGASLPLMLDRIQGCDTTVLAIETIDGEVFGAFCTSAWKTSPHEWYGNGGDSFLWRLVSSRGGNSNDSATTTTTSSSTVSSKCIRNVGNMRTVSKDDEEDDMEVERREDSTNNALMTSTASFIGNDDDEETIEVFKFAFLNQNIQQCHHNQLMIGGGHKTPKPPHLPETKWGYGLTLEQDLLRGSTSSCLTYDSPCLSKRQQYVAGNGKDGCSIFEVRNIEVWALTPCVSLEDAERSYNRKRFFHRLRMASSTQR